MLFKHSSIVMLSIKNLSALTVLFNKFVSFFVVKISERIGNNFLKMIEFSLSNCLK